MRGLGAMQAGHTCGRAGKMTKDAGLASRPSYWAVLVLAWACAGLVLSLYWAWSDGPVLAGLVGQKRKKTL